MERDVCCHAAAPTVLTVILSQVPVSVPLASWWVIVHLLMLMLVASNNIMLLELLVFLWWYGNCCDSCQFTNVIGRVWNYIEGHCSLVKQQWDWFNFYFPESSYRLNHLTVVRARTAEGQRFESLQWLMFTVCMFFQCSSGFPPCNTVSSHRQERAATVATLSVSLNGCLCLCAVLCTFLNVPRPHPVTLAPPAILKGTDDAWKWAHVERQREGNVLLIGGI